MSEPHIEELLDLLLSDWGPGGLVCWNAEGALIASVGGFTRLFGCARNGATPTTIAALWSWVRQQLAEDPGAWDAAFPATGTLEVKVAATQTSPLRIICLTHRSLGRSSGLTALLGRDVTEQRAAQIELERLRNMVAASSDALVSVSPELRYQAVNPAHLKLWGLDSEQVVGRKVEEVVGSKLFETTIKDRLLRCLRGEAERLFFIDELDLFPGGPRALETTYTPHREADGVITGVLVNLRDVTDRAAAEAAVRRSERHLASLLRAAPIGIGVLREDRFERVNPRLCDLLGYPQAELLGQPLECIVADRSDFQRVQRTISAILAGEGLGDIETRFRRQDDVCVDVLLRTSWLDSASRDSGIVMTVFDITERNRQAKVLQHSEERARALLEAMPDLMFRMNRQGIYLDYKASREDLAVQQVASLIGRGVRELTNPEFADIIEAKIAETLSARKLLTFEYQLDIPGRGSCDWECRMVPSGADEVIATVRDLTPQNQALRALQASENRYRLFADHSSDLISKHSLDGAFLYVSPSCRTILGYEPEELIGRSPYEFFHPDDVGAVQTSHDTILSSASVYRVRYRMRRKDGTFVWLETNSDRVEDPDHPQNHVIIAQSRDVTETHQLLQAMVQSQKMEAVGRLTAGIAHDFNNILGAVLGFAELARLRHAGADAKVDGYLEQIDIAGGRARDLVRQLMVFSRGESTLGAQPLPLVPMVKEVLKMITPTLPAKVRITLNCAAAPLIVRIDPLHVQQMLLNLILNARDAMPEGGDISVQLRRSSADTDCSICTQRVVGEWVELAVTDTGCGIALEDLEQLFQPFFTTKKPGEGSGMGLAVVAGLIGSYKGHALVHSKLNGGSTFRLLFQPV